MVFPPKQQPHTPFLDVGDGHGGGQGGQARSQPKDYRQVDRQVHGGVADAEPAVLVAVVPLKIDPVGHAPQVGQVAQQSGHKQVQQEEEHPAPQGKRKGQQALSVRPGEGPDGLFPVQQVIHRHPQRPGQGDQQRHVGIAAPRLPAGDRLVADPQLVRQVLLGHGLGPTVVFQPFTEIRFHRIDSFSLGCGYCSTTGRKKATPWSGNSLPAGGKGPGIRSRDEKKGRFYTGPSQGVENQSSLVRVRAPKKRTIRGM